MDVLKKRLRLLAVVFLAGLPGCMAGSFEGACVWQYQGNIGCAEISENKCETSEHSYVTEFHLDVRCADLGFESECETSEGEPYFGEGGCS